MQRHSCPSSRRRVASLPTGRVCGRCSVAAPLRPTRHSPTRRGHCSLGPPPPDMLPELDFSKGDGLVTVVAQDARTGAVLMVAHADREALERTVTTGEMHYRSRTRGLWHKGETSGNVQRVVSLTADCDGDAVLARVIPAGPACHRGSTTCFGAAEPLRLTNDVLARL